METVHLPHLLNHPLDILLLKQVRNASFLHQQLLSGNTDFEYAFLDASTLLSRNQVLAACFRAINDLLQGRMKSKNVHSEIVFAMSPNNNITESFRRFGVSDSTTSVLAIKVGSASGEGKERSRIEQHLKQSIEGDIVPFTDASIAEMRDESRIRKVYKVDSVLDAENFVLGSMALRGS